jgi:hypothetical protein
MLRTTLALATLALLTASAPLAAAQECTNRAAACPVSSNDLSVRIIDSTIAFNTSAQRWEETVCFVVTNAATFARPVDARLQIRDPDDVPVCFDSVVVRPLQGGAGVICVPEPEDCGGTGVSSTLTIRPTATLLDMDSYTQPCCAVYATPSQCSELPEAGDTVHVDLGGGPLGFTDIVDPVPSGSCAGEPEMSSTSPGPPFGIEMLLVTPIWLRRLRRSRGSAAVALLLGALVFGAARAAHAVALVLEVDPVASSIVSTLDLGDTIERTIVPAGSFAATIALGTLPDLHVTSIRVNPGSSVAASVLWAPPGESLGGFAVDVAFLEDGVASAASGTLTATRIGPNTSVFEVGNASGDPQSGIAFEVTGGRFELHGSTPEAPVDAVRDFSLAPALLLNATDDDARIEVEPNASGGVDVVVTIPVDACSQIDDDSSYFWLKLEGSLVLRGTVPACGDTLDNDRDGFVDFAPMTALSDPGCAKLESPRENPQCQDGINNDPDEVRRIYFVGGASAGVPPALRTRPDLQCIGRPAKDRESRRSCGHGIELIILLLLFLTGKGGGIAVAGVAPLLTRERRRPRS